MRCPACYRELSHLDAGGDVALALCEGGCGGHWLDHGELDKIRQANAQRHPSEFDLASADDRLARVSRFLDDRRR